MSAEQGLTDSPVQHAPQAAGAESFGSDNSGNSGGYELDEDGQRVPHGMGQSKSSRRRRRKRKGKGPEAAGEGSGDQGGSNSGSSGSSEGAAAPQVIASVQGSAEAQPAGQSVNQQPRQQNNGGGRSFDRGQNNQAGGAAGAPGGTKRWKKKFRERDRDRPRQDNNGAQASGGGFGQSASQSSSQNGGGFRGPDTHQPGNGGGGFKRKGGGFGGGGGGKQRGRSGFVGPMDHSYRPANGNVFDPTPSTMDTYGNGGGGRGRSFHTSDSQPIDYSQGRAIPIAPDAPTKIYFFIEDLFFTAKIQETARKLGVKVAFIKNEKEQIAALTGGEEDDRPGLIVFDLNNANAKPLTLIPKLKTKLKKSTSIVGFLSHLQGDLKAKAVEAGCDTVMPRAAFSQNLPNLLRRYGIEDVEEPNYNQ
jgi:hypothetical protein